jgi:hypothetical protein
MSSRIAYRSYRIFSSYSPIHRKKACGKIKTEAMLSMAIVPDESSFFSFFLSHSFSDIFTFLLVFLYHPSSYLISYFFVYCLVFLKNDFFCLAQYTMPSTFSSTIICLFCSLGRIEREISIWISTKRVPDLSDLWRHSKKIWNRHLREISLRHSVKISKRVS